MNSQVRAAHWPLRAIWTRTSMISNVSSVFDAALRLFQLLSCSHCAFPSPGITGHVAPWQVYGTSPVG